MRVREKRFLTCEKAARSQNEVKLSRECRYDDEEMAMSVIVTERLPLQRGLI